MTLPFPDSFLWGTASNFGKIETASAHNFQGLRAEDGHILERTTNHEKQRLADVDHIQRFGTSYRCSIDWARLQAKPYAAFANGVVQAYRDFFEALNNRGIKITLVLHHTCHPSWYERDGGWAWESNLEVFYDYAARCADAFGDLIHSWSTFDEPNLFALHAYYLGSWPPYEKSLTKASRVIGNMARAHLHVYGKLKERFPTASVGYALHTAHVEGRGFAGQASARLFDWWFYSRPVKLFTPTDYVGISHRAYLLFEPQPLTALGDAERLDQLGIAHDRLLAYKPEGLAEAMRRVYRDVGKPLWITATDVCTDDDDLRMEFLTGYLTAIHGVIRERIPVLGFSPGTPWDAFELHLGPTFRQGLLRIDLASFERMNTPSADWYADLSSSNALPL